MKYLAIFIFLSFVGMAIFGFAGMTFDLGHGHASCIAVRANGTACPESGGIFAFSAFHLSAFKKFSTAVFAAIVLLFAFVMFRVLAVSSVFPAPIFNLSALAFERLPAGRTIQLTHWLSLHENSPALI